MPALLPRAIGKPCLEDRGVNNLTPDRSLPMTTETPLRQRMIEDVNLRKLSAGAQRAHIHSCRRFATPSPASGRGRKQLANGFVWLFCNSCVSNHGTVVARSNRRPRVNAEQTTAADPGFLSSPARRKVVQRPAVPPQAPRPAALRGGRQSVRCPNSRNTTGSSRVIRVSLSFTSL